MQLYIRCTDDGVCRYPPHQHEHWEIMLYLAGIGYMYTEQKNLSFQPGTIIVVPPRTIHGSVSENGFKNISIGGSFGKLFIFDHVVQLEDNDIHEGQRLATLLYDSRSCDEVYKNQLSTAYAMFILQVMKNARPLSSAVDKIITELRTRIDDSSLRIADVLEHSGYAPDYMREQFKKIVGIQPAKFLTQLRMERAQLLIDTYNTTRPLTEIAESCGYTDYIAFSKTFHKYVGTTPSLYRKHKFKG